MTEMTGDSFTTQRARGEFEVTPARDEGREEIVTAICHWASFLRPSAERCPPQVGEKMTNFQLLIIFLASFGQTSAFSPGTILRQLTSNTAANKKQSTPEKWNENGRDEEYPWCFTGRLWFRPALVKIPSESNPSDPRPPPSVSILNLFGYTIGGTVALEYDTSPVGAYREYVTMGAVVSKRGALGQWGSRLYVSTQVAEDVCKEVWGVPAIVADINFVEDEGDSEQSLSVEAAPDKFDTSAKQRIDVRGWSNTRVLNKDGPDDDPIGNLPVLWTPTIKALWAPLVPFPASDNINNDGALPLHRLRLSASALRLKICPQSPSDALGIPIGIGLVVDNVLIEISRQEGEL